MFQLQVRKRGGEQQHGSTLHFSPSCVAHRDEEMTVGGVRVNGVCLLLVCLALPNLCTYVRERGSKNKIKLSRDVDVLE